MDLRLSRACAERLEQFLTQKNFDGLYPLTLGEFQDILQDSPQQLSVRSFGPYLLVLKGPEMNPSDELLLPLGKLQLARLGTYYSDRRVLLFTWQLNDVQVRSDQPEVFAATVAKQLAFGLELQHQRLVSPDDFGGTVSEANFSSSEGPPRRVHLWHLTEEREEELRSQGLQIVRGL